jgi:AAA+ superfamily predicted ATPase
MAKLHLISSRGTLLHELNGTAEGFLLNAEEVARQNGLAKRSYFPVAVREAINAAGYDVTETELKLGMETLNAIRRGESVEVVAICVEPDKKRATAKVATRKETKMTSKPTMATRYFESERTYPNMDARSWYDRLVGLDNHKRDLLLELELLLYPDRMAEWSRKHHGAQLEACEIMASRAPLILLEGDVGCGKTVLAETVGDPLAEQTDSRVHLLKVNTQVRGTGMVGEMTELIVQAFTQAEAYADSHHGEPVLLLIDEADALAAKRTDQNMHHEDKAGLNTLLQRIDSLRLSRRRIAVIFITNRPDALDPAVRRRSAIRLTFGRPDDDARAELFRRSLPELSLPSKTISELVTLTGRDAQKKYDATFTASDVTDRLIPAALRDAYAANRSLVAEDLLRHARVMVPTPLMIDRNNNGD